MAAEESSGVALTGKIGTLGLGAELNLAFSDSIGARLGYNQINYNYNTNLSDVNYDAKLKLRTISLLADWYPFQGSFRASGGVVYNDNQATLIGIPSGGGFTVNGNLDTSISSLQAKMSFNNIAPYVGIGWGNPVQNGKGWGMTSDVGVLFQGSPKTTLVPTCIGGCTSGTLSAVDAENAQLQSDLSNFKWWPVISIGISYQW